MNKNISARKATAEKHLREACEAAARADLELVEHAVTAVHPDAGRLHLYVNPANSEYFASQLTDANGSLISDEVGDIVVYYEADHDADGEPISIPTTVSDLMDKAMRTCPSDVRDQVLQPEDEDAECSGRFYLPLTGQL